MPDVVTIGVCIDVEDATMALSKAKRGISLNDAVEGKVIYIMALVFLVQTIYPITNSESQIPLLFYQFMYMLLMVAGVLVARESPRLMYTIVVLGIAWIMSGVLYAFNQEAVWALLLAFIMIAMFQVVIIRVLVEYMFLAKAVTRDVLYAAIAVYMMLGGIFGVVFGLIETVTFAQTGTNAFVDSAVGAGAITPWQTTLYYSYATLTTLGYGDILPVTMWARSAASLEAVVGVLYTTIIVARLVGMYVSNRETE